MMEDLVPRPAVAALPRKSSAVRWHARRVPGWHRFAEASIYVMSAAAIFSILLIFVFVGKESLPLFFSEEIQKEVTPASMWLPMLWPGYEEIGYIWQPVSDQPKFNVVPLLAGTLKITLISLVLAVPIGILAAVFVSQYAGPRMREIIKPVVELLAAVPSVVLGFFALVILASTLQDTFDLGSRLSALLAGVALGIALVPAVFTMSDEALRAVPKSYVEASIALGAAKWQTCLLVVLPAAGPGIAAAVALAFGRAIGETMIVLMASGNAAILALDPTESARTLSATIAAELAEVVFGGAHYTVLFFVGIILFVITFLVNSAGVLIIQRMRRNLGAEG